MKRFVLLVTILSLAMSGTAFGASYGTLHISNVTSTTPNITASGSAISNGTYRGDYDVYVDSVDATAVAAGFGTLDDMWHEVYCVDFDDSAGAGTFTIMDLQDMAQISATEAINLRKMVTVLGGTIGSTTDAAKGNEQAAAWEIVYGDGSLNLSGGTQFQVSAISDGGSVANAQAILTAIAANTAEAAVFGLYNATTQDWGIVKIGGGEVPEPMMLINLLGLALVGSLLSYRRLRR